jgi:perosamine synthetase
MWVRKRLDIGWLDLASAVLNAFLPRSRAVLARSLERTWIGTDDAIACLSVRSGFDLWLAALALPLGSEVLVSAITIPDMVRIIEEHGLVPVPVDVDPDHLAIEPAALVRAITPKTRALLVAHLFGTRQPLDDVISIAREHGLLVAEDCAQAYVGSQFTGHPEADVSMFSFGPIKTATALGGGILRVHDRPTLAKMRTLLTQQPLQSRWMYLRRVLKYAGMKVLSVRPLYGPIICAWRALGRDPDKLVNGAVRGFAGPDFFRRIRRQPSAPLLSLVRRRIAKFDPRRITRRTERGQRLVAQLDGCLVSPGAAAEEHTFWVFAVLADDRERLIAALRSAGFDGSSAHSMCVVEPPAGRPELRAVMAEATLPKIVYLPSYPQMPDAEIARMAAVVRSVAEQCLLPAREPQEHAALPV